MKILHLEPSSMQTDGGTDRLTGRQAGRHDEDKSPFAIL
jgi:hypothetical protein